MWPWEHLAVGYVALSVAERLLGRRPDDGTVVVLAVATQLPDLVDKPLAWTFDVLPSGTSLAHSLLVAAPAIAVVAAVTRTLGRPRYGAAFAVGYLAHLAGDVTYPVLLGDGPKLWFLLWPVVPSPPGGVEALLPHVGDLFAAFLEHVRSPAGAAYLLLEAALLGGAVVLWASDGLPGLDWLRKR